MQVRIIGLSVAKVVFEVRLPDLGIRAQVATLKGAERYTKRSTAGVYLRARDEDGQLVVYSGGSRHVSNRQAGHPDAVDWVLFITRANDHDFAFTADERKAIEYWLCAAASHAQAKGRVRCGNGTAPEDPGLSAEVVAAIRRPVLTALQAIAHPAAVPALHDLVEAAADLLDVTAASNRASIRPRPAGRGNGPDLVLRLLASGLLEDGDRLATCIKGVRQYVHVRGDGYVQDKPLGTQESKVYRSVTAAYHAHKDAVRDQLPAGETLSDASRRSGVEALKVDGGRYAGYSLAALRRLLP
jgi:hypothetical protein